MPLVLPVELLGFMECHAGEPCAQKTISESIAASSTHSELICGPV